jgi:hypothetical protein
MKQPISGSFNHVVDAFDQIVQKNPALAQKQGWPTNRTDQENWIDERECQRLIAHKWFGFVELEGNLPPPSPGGASRSGYGGAVAAGKSTLTGLAVYREMFAGSRPVEKQEAERRAAICVTCPLNNTKLSLLERFVARVAKGLTELLGIMRDMDLTTSRDKELGTCDGCDCPMAAKVHVTIPVILKHMPAEDVAKLHPDCWITK